MSGLRPCPRPRRLGLIGRRQYWLDWFNQMRERMCAFHPRSADDAYLVIIGRYDAAKPSELDWKG